MSLFLKKEILWRRFENSIIEVIELAIKLLKNKKELPINEDDLNREFYLCLVSSNYLLQKENKGLESPPLYEAHIQPQSKDISRTSRENKRPDFQWSITDINELDSANSAKQFVLECKRLGKAVGTWVLSENYVNHGINRFIDKEYGYAYGVISSAMLGYIQNMETEKILEEINSKVHDLNQDSLVRRKDKSNNNDILKLTQQIKREYPKKEFRLEHFWMDIRDFY